MKYWYLAFIILCTFSSCEKDEITFSTFNHDEIYTYNIHIDEDKKIHEYIMEINDTPNKKATYTYTDSTVTQKIYNLINASNEDLVIRHVFKLDKTTGYAKSSEKRVYDDYSTSIWFNNYEYNENGYLVKRSFTFKFMEDTTVQDDKTGIGYVSYTIENGNISKSKYYYELKNTGEIFFNCTDLFDYTEKDNLVDINEFLGEITGKNNKKLVKTKLYETDCFTGDDIVWESSKYSYKFDEEGYVIQKTELHTPKYSTSKGDHIYRTRLVTNYMYIFL